MQEASMGITFLDRDSLGKGIAIGFVVQCSRNLKSAEV